MFTIENPATKEQIFQELTDVCILYFAQHSTQIQEMVLLKTADKLLIDFGTITSLDIQNAFERAKINKQITVSLNDLYEPISNYFKLKYSVSTEIQKLIKENRENESRRLELENMIQDATLKYRECLKNKVNTLTIFECTALAKKYSLSKKIESSLVNFLWNEAKIENAKFDVDVENFLGNWEKTPERLYAQKIVAECLKREMQI
jgi:hypothetical protein